MFAYRSCKDWHDTNAWGIIRDSTDNVASFGRKFCAKAL
jgi:hypothetical protein